MTGRGALYLDTSCLLKLFFREAESRGVAQLLDAEAEVVVSELAALEAETQLRARLSGGLLTRAQHRRLSTELERTLSLEPFIIVPFPRDGFEHARRLVTRITAHCRTLDLLHFAVMDAMGLARLLTNDSAQGRVAAALGMAVTFPAR